MMFSATFNKELRLLAKTYLSSDHVRLRVGRPGSSRLNVQQQVGWSHAPRDIDTDWYYLDIYRLSTLKSV